MTRRIAFARLNQETNALSPAPTTLADFAHLVEGSALLATPEVPGFFRRAELAGFVSGLGRDIEPVPLLSAWAPPSGRLTRDTFDALVDRLDDRLRKAGRVDALYLALHGAMGVDGVADPELAILRAARERIGGAPIFASYDLHANLTRERVEASDALEAYRTNPHRDHARVGRRAAAVLTAILEGRARPEVAWRSLPMVLGGGRTIDFLPPMLAVFLRLRAMERTRGVLGASVLMCHPWNDHPDLGWSTVAVTDGDRGLADRLADELAEMCWSRRDAPMPAFLTAAEAIAAARRARLARRLGAVLMIDMSDLAGAGGAGDNTAILRALLEEGLPAYVPVRDPSAVAMLWEIEEGREVLVSIGAPKLALRGVVRRKTTRPGFGRSVVVEARRVSVVVVEGPALVTAPSFYSGAGLDPWRADVIVAKMLFPAILGFAPLARRVLLVQTRGVTDLDGARTLPRSRPVHPFDDVRSWR